MAVSRWYIGVAVAALVAQVLLSYRVYRLVRRGRTRDGTDGRPAADADVVACPDCGVENEAAYRYCRACVAELPVPTVAGRRRGRSLPRRPD